MEAAALRGRRSDGGDGAEDEGLFGKMERAREVTWREEGWCGWRGAGFCLAG